MLTDKSTEDKMHMIKFKTMYNVDLYLGLLETGGHIILKVYDNYTGEWEVLALFKNKGSIIRVCPVFRGIGICLDKEKKIYVSHAP